MKTERLRLPEHELLSCTGLILPASGETKTLSDFKPEQHQYPLEITGLGFVNHNSPSKQVSSCPFNLSE